MIVKISGPCYLASKPYQAGGTIILNGEQATARLHFDNAEIAQALHGNVLEIQITNTHSPGIVQGGKIVDIE